MTVQSRASRKLWAAKHKQPRRPVPVDLRGLCFNCFASTHRAAQCRSRPRCFKCRKLGHRSYTCPSRSGQEGSQGRVGENPVMKVWRRITPATLLRAQEIVAVQQAAAADATSTGAAEPGIEGASGAAADDWGTRRRRHRPRHRKRKNRGNFNPPPDDKAGQGHGGDASPGVNLDDGVPPAPMQPCIIDWSDRLDRAEQDLRRAVVITAVGDCSWVATEDVADMLSAKFDLVPALLDIRRSGPIEFLVYMADEESAINLSNNNNQPAGNGVVRLHCRRWTRHLHAAGGVLPALIDVELRGVSAHAWEVPTAESLLNPYGWVLQVHESTRNREDYSAFRVTIWCFNPTCLPLSRDLIIVEPWAGAEEDPPVKRTLV